MNALLFNVPESAVTAGKEDPAQIFVDVAAEAGVTIQKSDIVRAHRNHSDKRPRPLVAKFRTSEVRDEFFFKVLGHFRGNEVETRRVADDLTEMARASRKMLNPVQEFMYKKRKENNFTKIFFVRDKLRVDSHMISYDYLEDTFIVDDTTPATNIEQIMKLISSKPKRRFDQIASPFSASGGYRKHQRSNLFLGQSRPRPADTGMEVENRGLGCEGVSRASTLSVLSFNIQGLTNEKLNALLADMKDCDIIGLCEVWMSPEMSNRLIE